MKLAWTVESPASDGSKTQLSQSCGSNGVAMRSWIATSLLPTAGLLAVAATYAVVHVLAARRRRRERVAATEFKAKVAPYLVEAPEL